jgi:hypothetical protein
MSNPFGHRLSLEFVPSSATDVSLSSSVHGAWPHASDHCERPNAPTAGWHQTTRPDGGGRETARLMHWLASTARRSTAAPHCPSCECPSLTCTKAVRRTTQCDTRQTARPPDRQTDRERTPAPALRWTWDARRDCGAPISKSCDIDRDRHEIGKHDFPSDRSNPHSGKSFQRKCNTMMLSLYALSLRLLPLCLEADIQLFGAQSVADQFRRDGGHWLSLARSAPHKAA